LRARSRACPQRDLRRARRPAEKRCPSTARWPRVVAIAR
jgi:hypothetical protein